MERNIEGDEVFETEGPEDGGDETLPDGYEGGTPRGTGHAWRPLVGADVFGQMGAAPGELVSDELEDPKVAYEFFKGKSFAAMDATKAGFFPKSKAFYEASTGFGAAPAQAKSMAAAFQSSGVSRATTRHMEGLAKGAKANELETPMQRLSRLQTEIDELSEVVSAFVAAKDDPDAAQKATEGKRYFGADPSELLEEMGALKHQLEALMEDSRVLNASTSVRATTATRDQYATIRTHVVEAVRKLKQPSIQNAAGAAAPTGTAASKAAANGDSGFSYEIYCVPTIKPMVDGARIASLEMRLSQLESSIGTERGKNTCLPFKDISTGIGAIAERLLILDPQRADNVERRLKFLAQEMESIVRRRERLSSPSAGEDEVKVTELYNAYNGWLKTQHGIPSIVRRLRTLKALHQECVNISDRFNALEKQQADLRNLMESAFKNFEILREKVKSSMETTQGMMEQLNDRVTKDLAIWAPGK
eukprot:GHVU01122444.1.p1 GENE.GHVU01122444.1~~GHVU01122444.1.p1  ORF type:complete len:476 (+),score=76.51 GHVU01122444.1:387-1814(+)